MKLISAKEIRKTSGSEGCGSVGKSLRQHSNRKCIFPHDEMKLFDFVRLTVILVINLNFR